jgi:hypothetical protein
MFSSRMHFFYTKFTPRTTSRGARISLKFIHASSKTLCVCASSAPGSKSPLACIITPQYCPIRFHQVPPPPTAPDNMSNQTTRTRAGCQGKWGGKAGLLPRVRQLLPLNQSTSGRKAIRGRSFAVSRLCLKRKGRCLCKGKWKMPEPNSGEVPRMPSILDAAYQGHLPLPPPQCVAGSPQKSERIHICKSL